MMRFASAVIAAASQPRVRALRDGVVERHLLLEAKEVFACSAVALASWRR